MIIKRAGGTILGVQLTNVEKKALEIEVRKMLTEYNQKNELEMDALILWQLHTQLGLGKKKLWDFYRNIYPEFKKLNERYDMDISDTTWLCTHKLKDYGIDIEQWRKDAEEETRR